MTWPALLHKAGGGGIFCVCEWAGTASTGEGHVTATVERKHNWILQQICWCWIKSFTPRISQRKPVLKLRYATLCMYQIEELLIVKAAVLWGYKISVQILAKPWVPNEFGSLILPIGNPMYFGFCEPDQLVLWTCHLPTQLCWPNKLPPFRLLAGICHASCQQTSAVSDLPLKLLMSSLLSLFKGKKVHLLPKICYYI